jgi:predicted tellurium resistance membrane protein TerC
MSEIFVLENLLALATLTGLEVVLGIDNIIFIAILTGKLPKEKQGSARSIGLALAMIMRIALLLSLTWVMSLTQPLFTIWGQAFSGRDLILLIGGLFLMAKATTEIHQKLEGQEHERSVKAKVSFANVLFQIALLDIIFSLDSVITAVGMAQQIWIMVVAVILAVAIMMIFSGAVVRFIEKHPTFKMLALSFLLMIGVMLMLDGFGKHVNKGYIYFAMAFSLFVEILNMKVRKKAEPVHLHQ